MADKRPALGRGLSALIPDATANVTPQTRESSAEVDLDLLGPNPFQPRLNFDEERLDELAASIRSNGIIQPILVRKRDRRYEIIAGERRWRASQLAGLTEVPTLIREIPDEAALAMALIENIQRENLNPLEEALGLQRLVDEFSMTHQQAADAVGRSRPAASNLLRLLQLAKPVQDMLMAGTIDMGHARALLPLSNVLQVQIAQRIAQKGLSVREAERLVQREMAPPAAKVAPRPDRDLLRLQDELSDVLGATVAIKANRKGAGKLMIDFSDLDQLEGLLARLR